MEDWEYLSNPCHYELSHEQKLFVQKFYPEYAEKDPYSVLNWLHEKCIKYHDEISVNHIAAYL